MHRKRGMLKVAKERVKIKSWKDVGWEKDI